MERYEAILAYGKKVQAEKERKEMEAHVEFARCLEAVELNKDRLAKLVDIANLCLRNSIAVDKYLANGICHTLGFYKFNGKIRGLCYYGGGACGKKSTFFPKNEEPYFEVEGSPMEYRSDNIQDYYKIRDFEADFQTFETKFYNYVDKIIGE